MKFHFKTDIYSGKLFSLGRSVSTPLERTVRNGLVLTTPDERSLDLSAKAGLLRSSRCSVIGIASRYRVMPVDNSEAVKDMMRVSAKSSQQFSNEGDFVMTLDKK